MSTEKITRVIHFSGGQTSALMTIRLKPTDNDIVLFTDTGREHPKTYKFLNDFEANEGIKIHRAVYTNPKAPGLTGMDAWVKAHNYLPNRVKRTCTADLKAMTARRYLKSLGITKYHSFIGFRADEERRVKEYVERRKRVKTFFILYDDGINKAMVNYYWLGKSYRLEIPSILGNCVFCFLKGAGNLIKIMQHEPKELIEPWLNDEAIQRAHGDYKRVPTFIKGVSYKELYEAAMNQGTLFDLNEATPQFSCACTT